MGAGAKLHGVSMCLHEPGLEILLEGARFQRRKRTTAGVSTGARWSSSAYLACVSSKQVQMHPELGLSLFSAKYEEVDHVSNLSCQPLRAPPRSPAKGGRISCEHSVGTITV